MPIFQTTKFPENGNHYFCASLRQKKLIVDGEQSKKIPRKPQQFGVDQVLRFDSTRWNSCINCCLHVV